MRRTTIVLAALLGACHPIQTAPFQEHLLATIPDDLDSWVPPAFTPDGQCVAFVGYNHLGSWVFRDRWKSRRLDSV